MAVNPNLLSPCGLYCGVCGIYASHRDQNMKLKEKLAAAYGVSAQEIRCQGCLSNEPFMYCRLCPIKSCTTEKGYDGCHQCAEFPCQRVSEFPQEEGKRVILRSVPQRREMGTEKWVAAEEARYRCSSCQSQLFRGSKRCPNCKTPVTQD
jgi:hypothetical protein